MSAFPTNSDPLPLPANTGPQIQDLFTPEEIKKYSTNPALLYDEFQKRRQAYYANTNPPQPQQNVGGPQMSGITEAQMALGESEYKRKQQQLANNTNADPIAARVAWGPSAPESDFLGGGVGGGLADGLALIAPSKLAALGMLPGKVGKTAHMLGRASELPNELLGMAVQKATGTEAIPLAGKAIGRVANKAFKQGVGLSATDQFLKTGFGVK